MARAKELSLIQSPSESDVKEAQALQREWKKTGILPREQNKALAKVFYVACNLVLEKHFVLNLAIRKHKDFLERNAEEQLHIKIQLTRDLLARDQMELKTFQENLEKVNAGTDGVNKMVNAKFNQQVRKVFVKECMLEEYEKELKK